MSVAPPAYPVKMGLGRSWTYNAQVGRRQTPKYARVLGSLRSPARRHGI